MHSTIISLQFMSIILENITKTYGTQKALDDISFTINKGEIVGFLGPNGAGKSTTMKIISGYLKSNSGTAKICGDNIATNALKTKKKIGYLPEANPLYYDLYVREYLEFVAGVFAIKNPKSEILNIIEQTGLRTECHKRIGQLSKGYKQRTGLAAALLHRPEVLILDEPTSGLDPNQIVEIRKLIKDQSKNKTVLFSSHILQEVEALCDRVIIINKGKIVADDLLNNLKKNTSIQRVKVSFSGHVEHAMLLQIASAKSFKKQIDNSWMFETKNGEITRKELLQFSIAQNLDIASLHTEGVNLEEIFRELTQNINP